MITVTNLKMLLALIILISSNILISADTKYKVRRGDTIESIAQKYNTSVQQIKDMNYSIDRIFVGMTLNLPDKEENSIGNSINTYIDEYFKIGETLFMVGEYKDAAKSFSKSIKYNPSPLAYYNRGLCYYNMEKWRQSSEDLAHVIDSKNIPEEIKENAGELYEIAKHNHEVWAEERNASIAEFVGILVGTGATVASAVIANNSSNASSTLPASHYYQGSYNTYNYDGTAGPLAQAYENGSDNSMAQFYQQAQYQAALDFKDFQNQMEQQKKDFIKAYKQNFPYASDDDADVAYTNYLLAVQNEMNGSNSRNKTEDNTINSFDYQSQYERYENLVKSHYNSLTTIGTSIETDDGYSGTIGNRGNPGGSTVHLNMKLKDAQKQMSRIRKEAASKGIIITASKWETSTVEYK